MLLQRFRPAKKKEAAMDKKVKPRMPELDEFLEKRDYAGAISLLEFKRKEQSAAPPSSPPDVSTELWLGHCYFRAGQYKQAAELYEWLLEQPGAPDDCFTYLACCLFFLGMTEEAIETADKGPKSSLQVRLLFHACHKRSDEKRLLNIHQQLQDTIEDQLCLASIHFLRLHYNPAIDIYKKILLSHSNFIAVNYYLALCYYKLDFYEVSQEVLSVYLKQFPDSPAALNLKAAILYKMYTGKAAEMELAPLARGNIYPFARDLLKHNSIVFKNGDGALQVLPALVDVIPEARLNLIIYYLHQDDVSHALSLANEVEPQLPTEFLLKALVFMIHGTTKNSKDHLKTAEQFFRMVGESASECDTIVGRQSMTMAYYLARQWDDVVVYLSSIKEYLYSDNTFNVNYGQALCQSGDYEQAEAVLQLIGGEDRMRPGVLRCLTRAHIYCHRPAAAWDIYTGMRDPNESFTLLRIIANDCYKAGEFYYSAKAFDALENIDPSPEHWEGKRGAAAGLFKQLIHREAEGEQMAEVLRMLERGHHPQVDLIVRTIRKHCRDNNITL